MKSSGLESFAQAACRPSRRIRARARVREGARRFEPLAGPQRRPIADYLRQWEASCGELGALSRLPARVRELLQLD